MTTLGTPLSPHATKVMLLGSGELGKEVLIALQRLGVETIAVDRYDNAPDYALKGIDIDLRIQPADASGGPGWRISGQLLGPVGAGQATLQCGDWSASSGWNELCEFSFAPVPGGPCRLLLQGGDWDTEIGPFDLHGPA